MLRYDRKLGEVFDGSVPRRRHKHFPPLDFTRDSFSLLDHISLCDLQRDVAFGPHIHNKRTNTQTAERGFIPPLA